MRCLEDLFAAERGATALVFNGDFHWFDVADEPFDEIERGVSRHAATRGNVETEIAQPQAGALYVEAIPIEYDAVVWREAFLAQWPEGSDAYASYWRRITHGPRYEMAVALRAV